MQTYTVVLDYAGGTYVSQVSGVDVPDALRAWLGRLRAEATAGAISREVAEAFDEEPQEEPVLLEGLSNVWCACASAKGGLALANIVETAM